MKAKENCSKVILHTSAFILGCALAVAAGAQQYPSRPVRMIQEDKAPRLRADLNEQVVILPVKGSYATELETTIFVKNGPCVAGLGIGGEGFCSFSIAGPTGEGPTNPLTFTRHRRCTMVDALRIV